LIGQLATASPTAKAPDEGVMHCRDLLRDHPREEHPMPRFQARFYEDHFLLGRLIASRAIALGITRRQLVERLGFGDRLAKGYEILSEILTTGNVPSYLTTLAASLERDQTVVDGVIHLTTWQQDAEWQQEFSA
jgi:hypothetical protein